MNSVSLAPEIFSVSRVHWKRHRTNRLVRDCRNKQNYSSYNETVRRSDHGHTVWIFLIFVIHQIWFSSGSTKYSDCVGTLHANMKIVPPMVKKKKLKKGGHSGGIAVPVWQDKKQMLMIST